MPRSPSSPSRAARLLAELAGGDRRSIGRADTIARRILRRPSLFPVVVRGLEHADALVRMRCADVAEKVTRTRPWLLAPHKRLLLRVAARTEQPEVRWHVASMVPRLDLAPAERRRVARTLFEYLEDPSRILQVCALQALADLAGADERLEPAVSRAVRKLERAGAPAVRARARKLFRRLVRARR